jgi:hypothetical protein
MATKQKIISGNDTSGSVLPVVEPNNKEVTGDTPPVLYNKKKNMWQTQDGRLFNTPHKAKRHLNDK